MIDWKEINELVDRKNESLVLRIEKTLQVQTEFIAGENQDIKKSIDNLTQKVEQQNTSVRELKEWKAGVIGKENGVKGFKSERLTNWQLTGVIVMIIVGLVSIMSFVKSMNNSKEVQQLNYYKVDRMPAGKAKSITEDTIFINKLEKSTKELLK